jgi:DNA (cytosine-5)-methyltransferase 1
MKYFSTFTGIGGLDMGLADEHECVGFSDIKESSIEIYKRHYPKHKNFGDITKIDFKKLPDFDILTGGFPCQAFSLAGLRKGFEDRKGQLIFYIYDLIVAKKPQFVVLELAF